ncbi:hypothetical protein Bxe_B0818 [Paraburkholderia xenovorans LB400]|uniref:Uncharacterized protein n=1 Tax=Paraburkholderia xenovorans (strain LB400) TaxID=266265 RepID=Q13LA3_PARXL|nr:hypothetical protein Bxe_B0818 [Paraburkholderia xenovorans LB400]
MENLRPHRLPLIRSYHLSPVNAARYADETFIIRLPKTSVTNTGDMAECRRRCNSYGKGCRPSLELLLYIKQGGGKAARFEFGASRCARSSVADPRINGVFGFRTRIARRGCTSLAVEPTGPHQ